MSTGIKIESNQEDMSIWFRIKKLEVRETIQDHAITFWNQSLNQKGTEQEEHQLSADLELKLFLDKELVDHIGVKLSIVMNQSIISFNLGLIQQSLQHAN